MYLARLGLSWRPLAAAFLKSGEWFRRAVPSDSDLVGGFCHIFRRNRQQQAHRQKDKKQHFVVRLFHSPHPPEPRSNCILLARYTGSKRNQ